jgi:hypothetical protein
LPDIVDDCFCGLAVFFQLYFKHSHFFRVYFDYVLNRIEGYVFFNLLQIFYQHLGIRNLGLIVDCAEKVFEMGFLFQNFINGFVDGASVVHEHGFFLHDKDAEITDINQLVFDID